MDFSRPWILFGLIGLVPFLALVLWDISKSLKGRRNFLSDRAFSMLGTRRSHDVEVAKGLLMTLILGLILVALAGPQWGEAYEGGDVRGVQLMFVLDTSASMSAEDIKPSRLVLAKDLIGQVLSGLSSDMVALVTFAGRAYVQCPLTLDYDAFGLMVQATEISPPEEQGTDLGAALTVAEEALRRAGEAGRLLVLITDGEDHELHWQKVLGALKKQQITLFTVGVGAREGAPIPERNEKGDVVGWKKDRQGGIVKTRLDEATLGRLAQETNGRYVHLDSARAIPDLLATIKGLERRILTKQMNLRRIPRFQYPLALAVLLLMVEMLLTRRKITWRKPSVS
jgi:Ca-activated chloride channel family protein